MEDLSDIEREEQLRQWWSENWLWIVGGIVLGLAALAGYQYWQQTRYQAAEQDEAGYLAMLESLDRGQRDEAAQQADAIRKQHPKSPYADQADLALARADVSRREFDAAAQRLRSVADGSRDPQLRLVARSRLARVLGEQGKYAEALELLDVAKAGAFVALYHDIRGDVLAAKGDNTAAVGEYDAALAAAAPTDPATAAPLAGAPVIDRAYVELKRDALRAAVPAATATMPSDAAGAKP